MINYCCSQQWTGNDTNWNFYKIVVCILYWIKSFIGYFIILSGISSSSSLHGNMTLHIIFLTKVSLKEPKMLVSDLSVALILIISSLQKSSMSGQRSLQLSIHLSLCTSSNDFHELLAATNTDPWVLFSCAWCLSPDRLQPNFEFIIHPNFEFIM